jgi:hypothetical protein
MVWKAKYTKANYANGTTRLKRVFAFLPTYVDGNIVWLSTFEILQVYVVKEVLAALNVEKPNEATKFLTGQWVDASKRLINE